MSEHGKFKPGTFWLVDGRTYYIDGAGHWARADGAHIGEIPPLAPDAADRDRAVRLHLVRA